MASDQHFYVYALVRTPDVFSLEDVFYIGKGKGLRVLDHFKVVAAELQDSPKLDVIRELLGDNPTPEKIDKHAYVLVGDLSETDAFNVESLFIRMLGGPMGRQLLNQQGGHGKQATPLLVPLADARIYFDAEELPVQRLSSEALGMLEPSPSEKLVILVKGTDVVIDEEGTKATSLPGPIAGSLIAEDTQAERRYIRGWSPHSPWTQEEARQRANVWWLISRENIARIRALAAETGVEVLLMIKDPRNGSTVVRYAWNLEPNGTWLYRSPQWGLPLGEPLTEHPWRGRKLLRSDNGRQILAGHSSGIGYALRQVSEVLPRI